MAQQSLFDNYKYCENCRRPLAKSYQDDLCPVCKDIVLFREVKEYIRENLVNEYQVAEHFHLPHSKVKEWIREGRIEYREDSSDAIANLHCQRCGAPIRFGSLCPKCLRNSHSPKVVGAMPEMGDTKMHFLDIPNHDSSKKQ